MLSAHNSRQFRTIIILIFFWFAFAYVWLIWGWKDTNHLFTAPWWFDTAGHALYGFMGSFTLLYFFQNYAAGGIFRFTGRIFIAVVIASSVSLIGVFWEMTELFWDAWIQPGYLRWLGKAQSDSVDTSIDIIVNTLGAIFAMGMYGLYNFIFQKIHPEDDDIFKTDELIEDIRHVSRKIQTHRREHLKHIIPAIRELVRTIRKQRKKSL